MPYATQMRTSVAVRSVFPKGIGMNMNLSKCGSVEKMMPVLRVVRIAWKSSAIPVARYTQVLCSDVHIENVKVQLRITAMASTPATHLRSSRREA